MMSSKYPKRSNTHHDWLTVTTHYSPYQLSHGSHTKAVIDFLIQYFDLNLLDLDFTRLLRGIYEYNNALSIFNGSVIVGFDKQTVMVQLSGRGIEAIDEYYGIDHFIDCLKLMNDQGHKFRCTRWDLARDLYNWSLTYSPHRVWNERKKGNLVGHLRYFLPVPASGKVIRPNALKGRDRELYLGSTLYLGKNPFQLRIYNKLAERFAKMGVAFDFKRWTRWELQMNDVKSDYYFHKWLKSGKTLEETWKLIVSANMRFVVDHPASVDKTRNRRRLPTAKWWKQLIDTDDNWSAAPSVMRANTPDSKHRFYETTVAPNAILRLNYLTRGYLKNGVSVKDARRLAVKAFLCELVGSLRDKEKWVKDNKALFQGTVWKDLDRDLTMINVKTGELYDFDPDND